MRKTLLIYLIPMLGSLHSQAQDNFVPGHIITIDGDSIAGMINDQYWSAAPTSIQFQANGLKTYEPKDLLQFGVGTKTLYKSLVIEYDSTSESKNVSRSMQPTYKKDHVFLRVVLLAQPSLLEYKKGQTSHFFIQSGSTATELINHIYEREVNGIISKLANKQFVEQLRAAFRSCSQMEIDAYSGYSERELTELFQAYYQCNQITPVSYPKEKIKTTFGLAGGLSFDQMSSGFDGGIGYGAGFYLNFNYPNKLYKSSAYLEFLLRGFADQTLNDRALPGLPPQTIDLSVQSIKVSALYNTRLTKLSPNVFLEMGFAYAIGLSGQFFINEVLRGDNPNDMWGAVLGTGIQFAPGAAFRIRYELGSGLQYKDAPLTTSSGYQSFLGLLTIQL